MSAGVWIVLTVLIVANALYVAAEFGAVGVRRSRVQRMSDDGNWLATRLLPYLETPVGLDRYVGVSQIGITLSSLMLGAYAQATLSGPRHGFSRLVARPDAHYGPVGRDRDRARRSRPCSSSSASSCRRPSRCSSRRRPRSRRCCRCSGRFSLFRPFIAVLNGAAIMLLRAARRGRAGASSPALAGRDRPAHRREPRRRPARTRGTAAAASRAASRTPAACAI